MSDSYRDPPPGYGGGHGLVFPTLTPVVKQLLLINAVVFGLDLVLFMIPGEPNRFLERALGLSPELWKQFFPFVPFWQLLSYGFLHSVGDPSHILWNMLWLYMFGTMLEGIIGARRFAVVYVSAILAGAVLHMLAELLWGAGHPTIGASGAVTGVIIATAVLRPNAQVILLVVPIKLKWLATIVVAMDVYPLLMQMKTGATDFVAHYVHLGGALYGFFAVRRRWIWWDPIERWARARAAARENRQREQEGRMDELLAKISREGLGSLTRREKDFLRRMSDRKR